MKSESKKEKLNSDDMSTIARIIGECSPISTLIKENGIWQQSNIFVAANERCHIFATQE